MAQVANARQLVPRLLTEVRTGAAKELADARSGVERMLAVTGERTKACAAQARAAMETHMGIVHDPVAFARRHEPQGRGRTLS